MASLGFCRLLARTPCLLSSLNFCKFNVLYYNVLNGIILYAVGIYNLCSVTPNVRSVTRNRDFKQYKWDFNINCDFIYKKNVSSYLPVQGHIHVSIFC